MNGLPRNSDVTGVVLAGGRSRRMGGGDKGLLDVAGKAMLQHVIDRIKPQVATLAININGDPARVTAFGLSCFPDTLEGHQGPLAGLLSAMLWARRNTPQASWLASVPSDTPFLPLDLVARLKARSEAHPGTAAIVRSGTRLHPVVGLWPVELSVDLEAALDSGVRKVHHWISRLTVHDVDFPFLELSGHRVDPFFNVNTIDNLQKARALLLDNADVTNLHLPPREKSE